MIGVLAVQGGVREHERALDVCGVEHRQIRRPGQLAGINGLILPGGESTTISRLLDLGGLLQPLRQALADGMPAFGTCAGMILLATEVLDTRADAHQLGAIDITVRRNAFGRQVDSFEADLEVAGVAEAHAPMPAAFIRAPWVERVGEGVETLATVPDGPAAGAVVAVRQGTVLATSFHPEVTGDTRLHSYFAALVGDTGYTHP
ncbi:pyridoxal 5'-phosphate synthase glutaminase subunit PdxT [Corynebacterium halotolerans]|uniref:Pyridoxal 5'-phosphate synthase subunit PdxT n=1 Tax=Corynebacterium halotolerans YIM 70093 = DSM 44683 TaxID=1121362 RepID=M1NT27_9CORY|nr:pyridoxal 5'-phosphate synthase glutaminase subunit PdxT [Corynebacterium halotolerans]AGF72622.1 glutamine amidotransferase subunit PdxT [Corynebacterium halotolerans YIM 70093 = DSM 44683]